MNTARAWGLFLLFIAASAEGAAPQLAVPHTRLGQIGSAGPSAIWRGAEGGSFLIQTSGDIANGAGTLQRRSLDISGDGAVAYGAQPLWDAATVLAAGAPRAIFTSNAAGATIAFEWAALAQATRLLLDQPGLDAEADGLGELRTAFLRGDRTHELGQAQGYFRKRAGVLGDIVNSTPLIVGAPQPGIADSGHADFRQQFRTRAMAVYAGANDGMLHAFSTDTGAELFAYVPAALSAHLAALSSPGYKGRPYVDGSASHGDVRIGGVWRTVLASGLGMGARGVFALDITDPAHFTQGLRALWEFTDAHDPAMGHVRDAPLIAKVNTGKGASDAAPRYFAIVSSGLNNLAPDGGGALFLLALNKTASQKWERGVNYFSIGTAAASGPLANALSGPALVLASDGSASRAYAGDLHGNLWRFDFKTMTAHRLFTARDQEGAAQPIAHAPKVVFAPGGGYLVLFATGKLIEESDLLPASFLQQSVYAIFDAPGAAPTTVSSRSQLAARTLTAAVTGYGIGGGSFAYAGPDAKKGWYLDFPNARTHGERASASPASIEGAIALASMLPAAGKDGAASSRLYVVDALTGFAYAPASGAIPNAATGELAPIDPSLPLLFVDSALSMGERNPTGGATATRRVTLLKPHGGAHGVRALSIDVRYPAGRMGWREVSNWQELHQAATGKRR